MRRTTGAILIETRPERISMSAWRGEARNASKPKRAMSRRPPTIVIISIAQQASPKVAGNMEFDAAQRAARSSVVVSTRSSTPDVDERDDEQDDEDDRLGQRERAERVELDGYREQEDDLDVEQDEQHRDQVEADPEAEVLLDLGGQAALVRIRGRLLAAEVPRPEQR